MNDRMKTGLGVGGILAAGAAIGIGAKALGTKVIQKIKDHKAKKEEEKVNNEK